MTSAEGSDIPGGGGRGDDDVGHNDDADEACALQVGVGLSLDCRRAVILRVQV